MINTILLCLLTLKFKNFKAINYKFILSFGFELFDRNILRRTKKTLRIKEWNDDQENL